MVLTILVWLCIAAYVIVVAGWWGRHVLISLIRPMDLVVDPVPSDDASPRISVVIPARNESSRIAECITSLLAQGGVVREIVVVDDRSTDGTAEVAQAAARGDSRVRVVTIAHLPDGWAGKAHACQRGGESALGDWILFTDADCQFLPNGLPGALAYAERHDTDLLSLWVAADNRSFWEHMLIPLCGALILYWFPPLEANRAKSRLAYANGQFVLMRRDAWQRIGGHACARNTVIEDIPLARHAKQAGLRLRTAVGPRIMKVRMYCGFREVWHGWTRIFIGALRRPWKLAFSVWSLIGGSLLPSVAAPATAILAWQHGLPNDKTGLFVYVLLWAHFVAVYTVSFRIWGLCGCKRRHLLLYPLSVVIVMAVVIWAWWGLVTRRPIIWRGSVTGSATETSVAPSQNSSGSRKFRSNKRGSS